MPEDTGSNQTIKDVIAKSLGQLGVGAVLAALLLLYYQAESRRWDERMRSDEKRWEALFTQYKEGTSEALKAIETCCHDRLQRLEEIESAKRRTR